MRFSIAHELPGRIRISLEGIIPQNDTQALKSLMSDMPGVEEVKVLPRIGCIAISYSGGEDGRETLIAAICAVSIDDVEEARKEYHAGLVPSAGSIMMDIVTLVSFHLMRRFFLPAPLRVAWAVFHFLKFAKAALRSLGHARLDVPVLDAAAIGMSFAKGDPKTAASTMFLLDLGETLEEYTQARSESELIYSLMAVPEKVSMIRDGEEVSVQSSEVQEGDIVVARTGMSICIDGTVIEGTAMVNQANLTGEPLAIERTVGDDVFAGTAVEDGLIKIRARAGTGSTKLRSIVTMVEQSEQMKGEAQSRREHLADRIVPWNFLLAGIVALSTRSLIKTSAALMVDYSCALKLTGSIAVLSAMSQSAQEGFTVRGSKSLETLAEADTIVFDKTGTLTNAEPKVACILAFDGWDKSSVLRFAACLEEHFPHPVARAVVREASERGLRHRERHAEVEYLVAHGIASSLDGKRVVIGSEHFVVEDEHVEIPKAHREHIAREAEGCSVLYLAVDGDLVGVIGVNDPIKPGVDVSVAKLRSMGLEHVVMLTGDNAHTAEKIAAEAGMDEFYANMLPEDKHSFIEELRSQGRKVVMVGDGVNDSPALSAANVGIAMGGSTAIAREVADITLASSDLDALVRLRSIATELMQRLGKSFAQVMTINSVLLAGGISGMITPQVSSLAHNATTVALALRSSRKYGVR